MSNDYGLRKENEITMSRSTFRGTLAQKQLGEDDLFLVKEQPMKEHIELLLHKRSQLSMCRGHVYVCVWLCGCVGCAYMCCVCMCVCCVHVCLVHLKSILRFLILSSAL